MGEGISASADNPTWIPAARESMFDPLQAENIYNLEFPGDVIFAQEQRFNVVF